MKKLILALLFLSVFGQLTTAQGFYDLNTINTIEIEFEQENWDEILDQLYANGLNERLQGEVTINEVFFDSVGIRYKGNSSYSPNRVKNPFNIKLDYVIYNQELDGYGTLKLSNGFKDPSFVRETLGYEIARKYLPGSLSNYANVYVNGTYLGLYTSNQDVDKYFMRTHFSGDENARIKGEISQMVPGQGVWNWLGSDSTSYFSLYALESDFGWVDLISFLDTLNNHNTYVENVLNVDRLLWMIAFDILVVNLDAPVNMPQNYYLYKDDADRFNIIPWDLNETFGGFNHVGGGPPLNLYQMQHLDPFFNSTNPNYPIISKILNNQLYKRMYVAHIKTMLEELFNNDWYVNRALEIQDIIDTHVQADPNKFYTYQDFLNNINYAVGGGPPPAQGLVPGITELMGERINFLNSHSWFQSTAPEIGDINIIPETVAPYSEVWITAEVENATLVKLVYRHSAGARFAKTDMFDDGNHNDGAAGDGIYGAFIMAGSTDIQYYIFAENNEAAAFSPARAEYQFYTINITGDVVINEFMADNETTVADQDGEYDDWIEFYNNSGDTISLGGYFLSDDASEPDKWFFPDTIIAAGGYLIVWADDDEEQEGLHANFKLSKSGETIILSDQNINILDEVIFGQQKPDTTNGRYPNGTGDFVGMLPTFGAENSSGFVGTAENLSTSPLLFLLQQNYPNPFSQKTTIVIRLKESCDVSLDVFNAFGQKVEPLFNGYLQSGEYRFCWQANNLTSGMYFCRLSSGHQTQMKKMIKK